MTEIARPTALAIVGPTASGKSRLALEIARSHPGCELVSIDAFQVYRGMDIGTATPSVDERAEVPHHLIDIVDPSDEFTVAEFQHRYRAVMADIAARGGTAVLVGGTGLYLRAAVDGLELPGRWPTIRTELEGEIAIIGPEEAHRRLVTLDPDAAARIEPTNARRLVRALEVCLGSGRPFSSYGPGLDAYPPTPILQIGLRWGRDALAVRIEERVRAMITAGWLDEVGRLMRRPWSRTATQAIGYSELAEVVAGRRDLDEAVEAIVLRTRQFAVRQERWFRRDPRLRWIDVMVDPVSEAMPLVVEWLAASTADSEQRSGAGPDMR